MPLKTITGVKVNSTPIKAKSDIPIVQVNGTVVRDYNAAADAKKRAEELLIQLRPELLKEATPAIFSNNCAPECLQPITSVKVQDAKEESACISFQNSYSAVDAEVVEAYFDELGVDVNLYVTETLAASFDSSIWTDDKGTFNKRIYEEFRVAIEAVSKKLKLVDKDGKLRNPLSVTRKVVPRPDFHQRRFKDFSEEQQPGLSEVLPNKIVIKPERKNGE